MKYIHNSTFIENKQKKIVMKNVICDDLQSIQDRVESDTLGI